MASPLTIQPAAAAGKDAFIAANSSSNFGNDASLYVGDNSATVSQALRSLIALGVAGTPAGALFTSATLSLWEHAAASSGGGPASWAVELRRVLRNWVETQVTQVVYATAANWGTAGCSNASDRDAAVLASTTLDGTAAAGFVSWSGAGLTAFCQGILDGTITDYGLLLSAPTAEALDTTAIAYNAFYSSDYATDAAKRPKLVLAYLEQQVASVTTTAITDIAATTAASGGTATADQTGKAITARGVCWGTSTAPTVAGSHTADGSGTGAFTGALTGLSAGTTYHVRAYVTNVVGTSYGPEVDFTTIVVPPTVTTTTDSSSHAPVGGNVTSAGGGTITAKGVCWGTGTAPTTGGSHTTDGTGTGAFASTLTGLLPGTAYHARAYGTNEAGTGYGAEIDFTTAAAGRPIVSAPRLSLMVGSDALGWVDLAGSAIIGPRTKGMPGGDGSLEFTLPPDVARSARNQIQNGARVKLTANGKPDFGGRIANDPFSGVRGPVQDAVTVECSGLWAWADRYKAFAWVWNDADTAQWTTTSQIYDEGSDELIASEAEAAKYTSDTEGRLFILADRGNSFAPYSNCRLNYWLLGGLETGCEIVGLDVEYMCDLPFLPPTPGTPAVHTEVWSAQTSGTTEPLAGVAFSDASHGWAVGDNGTILATTDGGAHWSAQTSGTAQPLHAVAFSDATHGWVVGDDGTILATTNGGSTWSAQTSGWSGLLKGVAFPDASHGWAVGYDEGGVDNVILATTNGGTTWTAQTPGVPDFLTAVAFSDATHGWVVGDAGIILVTTDGGANWSAQDSGGTDLSLSGVAFGNANCGWVVADGGAILATTGVWPPMAYDAGGLWSAQTSESDVDLRGATFVDVSHGWVVGDWGAICATADGGATWIAQTSGTTVDLYAVAFPDVTHGWAVGTDGTILAFVVTDVPAGPPGPSDIPGPWALQFQSRNNPWDVGVALGGAELTPHPDWHAWTADIAAGAPNRCLSLSLWRNSGAVSPVDEVIHDPWVWVHSVTVRCRMDGATVDRTVYLSDALCDMATKPGLATVTAGEVISLGEGNDQITVRSMTSLRGGMADLAGLYSGELEYWFDMDEAGADRFNHHEKPVVASPARNSVWHYGDAAGEDLAGLVHDPEAYPDWIRLVYQSDGVVTVPDGTTRDVWYPATPPTNLDASVQVVTDYSGQMLTDAHAAAIAQRIHERIDASQWSGSVPIPETVTDTLGRERSGSDVRQGDRLSVPQLDGATDLYVTDVSWDWSKLTGSVTVGYPWDVIGAQTPRAAIKPFDAMWQLRANTEAYFEAHPELLGESDV